MVHAATQSALLVASIAQGARVRNVAVGPALLLGAVERRGTRPDQTQSPRIGRPDPGACRLAETPKEHLAIPKDSEVLDRAVGCS